MHAWKLFCVKQTGGITICYTSKSRKAKEFNSICSIPCGVPVCFGVEDSYVAITDELILNLVMSKRWKQNWQWIHELENSGKAIDELSMRQRKRKLEATLRRHHPSPESYADTLTMHTS